MSLNSKNEDTKDQIKQQEQEAVNRYGKLPAKSAFLARKLQERRFFDSGDYALSKAGKSSDVGVTGLGSEHPTPQDIPHSHNTPGSSTTPSSETKE